MSRYAGRRKVKKRKVKTEKTGVKLGVIAGIMVLAVLLGFLTARFVIGPVIGYNADESEISLADDKGHKDETKAISENEETEGTNTEETGYMVPSEGYALQFGVFSTEEAAKRLCEMLKEKGIATEVIYTDEVYKVISPVTDKKEDVIAALEEIREKEVTDVFIASF